MQPDYDDPLAEEHEEPAKHDAWVIPYADLITLLMAMFIALFASSTVDLSKFKEFAIGFNQAIGGKVDSTQTTNSASATTGTGPLTGGDALHQSSVAGTSNELKNMLDQSASAHAQRAAQRRTLDALQQRINQAAEGLGFTG